MKTFALCLGLAAVLACAIGSEEDPLAALSSGGVRGGVTRGELFWTALVKSWPHAPVIDPHHEEVADASTSYTPVVLMHGLGDSGTNAGMESLAQSVSNKYPGIYSVAAPVADGLLSFIEDMDTQVEQFASYVSSKPELANGFHAVGLSQGGPIVRAYIERYNNPPVKRFVSVCGPLTGVYDCPKELRDFPIVGQALCNWYKSDPYSGLLGDLPLGFTDYFVTVDNEQQYLDGNKWLTSLNNQGNFSGNNANSTYTSNWASLDQLLLVGATEDTVVYPWQSEWFGGWDWTDSPSAPLTVFNYTEWPPYQNNAFGLKTLIDAGSVTFKSYAGDHLRFSTEFWNDNVLPVLGTPAS